MGATVIESSGVTIIQALMPLGLPDGFFLFKIVTIEFPLLLHNRVCDIIDLYM